MTWRHNEENTKVFFLSKDIVMGGLDGKWKFYNEYITILDYSIFENTSNLNKFVSSWKNVGIV